MRRSESVSYCPVYVLDMTGITAVLLCTYSSRSTLGLVTTQYIGHQPASLIHHAFLVFGRWLVLQPDVTFTQALSCVPRECGAAASQTFPRTVARPVDVFTGSFPASWAVFLSASAGCRIHPGAPNGARICPTHNGLLLFGIIVLGLFLPLVSEGFTEQTKTPSIFFLYKAPSWNANRIACSTVVHMTGSQPNSYVILRFTQVWVLV